MRLRVGEGLAMAALGVAAGLPVALWATRFLAGELYGVGRLDPASFAGAVVGLLTVAALASWWPARRATTVSPLVVLREE